MNRSLLIAALVAFGLTACGKKEEKPAPPPAPAPTAPAPTPAPTPAPAPAAAPEQKSDAGTPGGMATTPAAPGATGSTGMGTTPSSPTTVQDNRPDQKTDQKK